MDKKIKELYSLLLKHNWRVDKVARKTIKGEVIIDIWLASPPNAELTTYDTSIELLTSIP